MRRLGAASALLFLLVLPGAGHAAFDPLGGGAARLTLDKGFARFLAANGVRLSPTAGARRRASSYTLPVTGGSLDPTEGKGEIDTEGTLVFENDRKRVPLRGITLKTNHSPLVAKVGGSQLKVANSAKLAFARKGFDSAFSARKLRLTAKVATRLNKKLRPESPFEAGQLLGTLAALAKPRLTAIEAKGKATLVFDAAFVKKLDGRFVSLNPIFPAEHVGPTFTYPIVAGGSLAPDASEGELRTGGTTEMLQLGSGQVFWKELWFDMGLRQGSAEADIEPSPSLAGKVGRVAVFSVGQGSVSADPANRTISISAPLALTAEGAKELNEAFAQGEAPAFFAGEAVGALSGTAQGQ